MAATGYLLLVLDGVFVQIKIACLRYRANPKWMVKIVEHPIQMDINVFQVLSLERLLNRLFGGLLRSSWSISIGAEKRREKQQLHCKTSLAILH